MSLLTICSDCLNIDSPVFNVLSFLDIIADRAYYLVKDGATQSQRLFYLCRHCSDQHVPARQHLAQIYFCGDFLLRESPFFFFGSFICFVCKHSAIPSFTFFWIAIPKSMDIIIQNFWNVNTKIMECAKINA